MQHSSPLRLPSRVAALYLESAPPLVLPPIIFSAPMVVTPIIIVPPSLAVPPSISPLIPRILPSLIPSSAPPLVTWIVLTPTTAARATLITPRAMLIVVPPA